VKMNATDTRLVLLLMKLPICVNTQDSTSRPSVRRE
jgi:hypothetical protein